MTCDTTALQNRGISFALSEGELIWPQILEDAVTQGELAPVYGGDRRWDTELEPAIEAARSDNDLIVRETAKTVIEQKGQPA